MTDGLSKAFLTAEWRYLAMLNYEVAPEILLPFVPKGTELDSWSGKTFLNVVGFLFVNTRCRLECDIENLYGKQFAGALSAKPSSAFLADGSAVTLYRGRRIV